MNTVIWNATQPVGQLIRERAQPGDTLYVAENEAGFYQQARVEPASKLLYDSVLQLRPQETPDLCALRPRFIVLPTGTPPAYLAGCLTGFAPVAGTPAPTVLLER